MTLKEELAQAQTRITELEGAAAPAADKISQLELDAANSSETITKFSADLKAEQEKTSKLEADLKSANERATASEADVARLQSDAKTADERSREIAARHGANLPPKDPVAGNHASGNANEMTREAWNQLTPRAQTDFIQKGGKLTD